MEGPKGIYPPSISVYIENHTSLWFYRKYTIHQYNKVLSQVGHLINSVYGTAFHIPNCSVTLEKDGGLKVEGLRNLELLAQMPAYKDEPLEGRYTNIVPDDGAFDLTMMTYQTTMGADLRRIYAHAAVSKNTPGMNFDQYSRFKKLTKAVEEMKGAKKLK